MSALRGLLGCVMEGKMSRHPFGLFVSFFRFTRVRFFLRSITATTHSVMSSDESKQTKEFDAPVEENVCNSFLT